MCTYTQTSGASITVIASEKTWIEDEAIQQLKTTAELKGMKRVVGLPDLHPPVGGRQLAQRLCLNPGYIHI